MSRAVFVVDKGGIQRHSVNVSAVTSEPDYRSALDILLSLLDPAAWLWAAVLPFDCSVTFTAMPTQEIALSFNKNRGAH